MEEIQKFRNKNREVESFHTYRRRVQRLTEKVKDAIPGIEERGFKTFHIDHRVSIYRGYKNGIPAEEIADLSNLHLIPADENLKKGPFGLCKHEHKTE